MASGATLLFPDETGLLMAPLLRTTLAARGRTPRIEQRASHRRDKVSVAAALWRTPCGLVRLAFRTYPDRVINDKLYALHWDQPRLRTFPANSPLKW